MEGLFVVKVIGCRLTRDTELFGKMDPYCLLQTGDQKAMTSIKKDAGKKCEWNESFTFYVKQDDVIKFQVWDEDPGTDDLVGEGVLTVSSSYIEKQGFSFVLSYASKGSGELDLEVQFFPQEKKKIEEVKKYQNLIRDRRIKLEKYQKEGHEDVEIINSSEDSRREEEVRLAIEKDKAEIQAIQTQFNELFAVYDKELAGMNGNLSSLIKENSKLKETIAISQQKLEDYRKPIIGGHFEILCQKAYIVRNVGDFGEMDPYVVFYLDKNSVKSNVAKHQGKTPVWNQNLKLKRNNNEDIVRFDVIDHNELLKSQIIGYGSFSLFLILRSPVKKSFTTSLFYKGNKIGCLELEIQFFN